MTTPCGPSLENTQKPIVWSIAGHDTAGGAGLAADSRAIDALGAHPCAVVAALTAQNSRAVQRVDAVSPEQLDAQLAALADDLPPTALKTGLLGSAAQVRVLARWVDRLRQQQPHLPLVVDPVLRASTGDALAPAELRAALRDELLPRATVITPNRAEAAALLGGPPLHTEAQVQAAAQALRALGAQAVAITGGDAPDAEPHRPQSRDWLDTPQAQGWAVLPRIATRHTHGTGCTLASATAAALAQGHVPVDALLLAKALTAQALAHGHAAGTGPGPVWVRPGLPITVDQLPDFSLPGQPWAPPPGFPVLQGAAAQLGLYAVVDSLAWLERVLAAGVRTVQLRIKDPATPGLDEAIRTSVARARAAGAQLYINDHWRLALQAGAHGVHLGQDDLVTADLPALARAGLHLGVSTHSVWEVCRAWALRPSYIACGPIHPTTSKAMPWRPQGLGNLAFWSQLLPTPVVAIGGMTTERAHDAAAHGAQGVALITAITQAPDPQAACTTLTQAVARGGQAAQPARPLWPRATLG